MWFDAAAPAFLIDMLMERGVDPDALDDRICDHYTLSIFDPDDIVMETLLFQTGCITIAGTEDLGGETLYPEVSGRGEWKSRIFRWLRTFSVVSVLATRAA